MPNKVKVENLYRTTVTSSAAIPASGDFTFDVAVAPQNKNGFLILGSENISTRQIFYYHDVIGNTIYVRGINRITAAAIAVPSGYSVKMNDVAEIFNYFGDNISTLFYIEKMGGLVAKVWGGYLMYNNNQVSVADKTLTLTDGTTNYIKYDAPTNNIFADTIASGNIKCEVVCSGGVITSILYRTSKESYLDFAISITGALPSQGGNAGKVLITDGTNVSWGISNLPRNIGLGKTIYVDPATGNEVVKDSTFGSSIEDTDLILPRDATTGNEKRVPFSNLKNQLSSAGKITQNITLAEAIPSGEPTAVAIRTSFTRNDFVPLLTGNSGNPDFIVSQSASFSSSYDGFSLFDKNATTSWYTNSAGSHWVKINFAQRRCITSLKIQAKGTVFEPSGWKLQGSHDDSTYTDIYTSASSTSATLTTHTFTNTTFYKYYRLLFPSHPSQGEIVTVEFNESWVAPYALSAYKTQTYELSEVCQFAGFVQGPKSIGDTQAITVADGTPVGGFTGLSILSKYYLSNTPGLISTTPGTISRLVGYTLYDPTVLIIDNGNLLPGTNITR